MKLLFFRIGKDKPEVLVEYRTVGYCLDKQCEFSKDAYYTESKGYFKITKDRQKKVVHRPKQTDSYSDMMRDR